MAVEITSREELEAWLEDKPREWAQVVALRSALTVAPLAIDPKNWYDVGRAPVLTLAALRAMTVAIAVHAYVGDDPLPHNAALDAADAATKGAEAVVDAYASYSAAYAVFAAANVAKGIFATKAINAIEAADYEADQFDWFEARLAFWAQQSDDCELLEKGSNPEALLGRPLWNDRPDWFQKVWGRASQWLSASPDGFDLWREWYYGRLEGLPRAFKDFDEDSDRAFYTYLIEQDNDWWKREPRDVNADIKAKVEELRKPPPPSDEELEQNPSTTNYALDEQGISIIAPEALPNGLSNDLDTQDGHAEIREWLGLALERSQHAQAQASEILPLLERFDKALGRDVGELRPLRFVSSGMEIVRQTEKRTDENSMAIQFSNAQEDAFVPLSKAIESLALFETKLRKIWQADYDESTPVATKTEIAIAIKVASEVGQLSPDVRDDLEQGANAIPDNAPANSPERKTASERLWNWFRSIGKGAKRIDGASKSVERPVKFYDRVVKMAVRLKEVFPEGSWIRDLLEWLAGGGGAPPV